MMSKSKKIEAIRSRSKEKLKVVTAVLLALIMTVGAVPAVFSSEDFPVREGDYADAGEGNVLMGIEGEFVAIDEAAKEALLAEVNRIRREACEEGIANPNDRTRNGFHQSVVLTVPQGLLAHVNVAGHNGLSEFEHTRIDCGCTELFVDKRPYARWFPIGIFLCHTGEQRKTEN